MHPWNVRRLVSPDGSPVNRVFTGCGSESADEQGVVFVDRGGAGRRALAQLAEGRERGLEAGQPGESFARGRNQRVLHGDENLGAGVVLMAFVLGAVAGAAVALLYAPATGEETRDYLGQRAREGREKVVDAARQFRTAGEPEA